MANNSITNYLQRLGKSISYAAYDVLKEQVPVTTRLIESNAQTVRDTIKSVVDSKNTASKIADQLNITYTINAIKRGISNAKEDIKSGTFVNPEREQQQSEEALFAMMSKMMGEDVISMANGEFDMSQLGDESEPSEEYPIKGIPTVTKGDTVVATVMGVETRRATNAITDTLTAIANSNSQNQKSIASIQISQNERQTLILNAGLSSLAQGMNSLIEFNNKVLKIQADNTKLFQEKMVNLTTENNAIFKELIEIQRALYKPKDKNNEEEDNSKDIFANGFNLRNYMDYVKGNLERNPFFQMASMFIQSLPMFIQEIVNNPMQFVTKKVIDGLLGPTLKTALQSFDNTISGAFRTVLARLYDFGNDPNNREGLVGQLARMLGFKQRNVKFNQIDTSKYNKGAMSWNGIAQKALVEIIPAHLRRIEAAATGQGERYFNYQSGKWMTARAAARKEKEIDITNARNATSEIRKQIEGNLAPFTQDMSREEYGKYQQSLLKFMQGIYERGSVDYKDIIRNPNRYGDDERIMQLLLRALNKVDRDAIIRATGKIANAKKSKERMIDTMDMSNQGIHNDIASGAFIGTLDSYKSKESKFIDKNSSLISTPAMNLTTLKDSRGMTLYDYQLLIYRELFAIRNQGLSGGGKTVKGKKAKNSTRDPFKGFSIPDNELPSIISREQNIPEEDPYQSAARRERIEYQKQRAEQIRSNMNRVKAANAGLDVEDEAIDWELFHTDDDYANSILERLDEYGNTALQYRDKVKKSANSGGVLGNVIGMITGSDNEANEGYPQGIDPDAPFIEQMTQAATIGQKLGVINRNIRNIVSAPTTLLTSVITTADKFMYEFLFEKDTNTVDKDGKKINGLFHKIISEIEDTFSGVNDWMNDIFKKLSESGDGIGKKIKDFLKNTLNFDVDEKLAGLRGKASKAIAPVGAVLKSGIKNNFNEITSAFRETAADLGFKRNNNEEQTESQPATEEGENQNTLASGTKNVKRGGLAFISEGEAIIPADLNPWNPDRDKVDRNEQSKNESRMKQRFMSKLGSSLGKYIKKIPQHASGVASYINKMPKEMIVKILNELYDDPSKAANDLEAKFGIKLDPNEIKKAKEWKLENNTTVIDEQMAKTILSSILIEGNDIMTKVTEDKRKDNNESESVKMGRYTNQKGVFNGLNQFMLSAFGTDSKMAAGDIAEFTIKHSPELAGGGIGGALIGTILPLGGPLFGAIAGAVATLLARNKSAMDYLFGSEMTDPKTGKVITKEGIIPRKIVNTMQKYLPDMKKYGIVGTLTGLITPFGPLGGLMIGAGASIIKNNEDIKQVLFGDETGLINKERKKYIKKALPNIGAGVLATLFMGPFGILGNAILGSGLGMLSTTESFKRIMLGTKDRNGVRHGGLAGAIREQITEPFKRTMGEIRDKLGSWFRDKILSPIGRGLVPIGKVATSVISWGMSSLIKHFREKIGGSFMDRLFNFALARVRNAGGLGKFIAKKVGGIASFGSRQVERLGDRVKVWGLRHGFGENFTAQQRLEVYGRNKMGHTDRAAFDRALVNMNPKELQSNVELLNSIEAIQNGTIDSQSEDKVRSEATSLFSDLQNDIGRTRGFRRDDIRDLVDELRKIRTDKDLERVVSLLDSDKYDFLDEQAKEQGRKMLLQNGRRILEYRKRVESLKDSRTFGKARQRMIENFGLAGFDDETINKHLADFKKYANNELERQDRDLKKQLLQGKEEGKLPEDATVDNLVKINDFQQAQLDEQKEMNKNLRTLIDVVLGNKNTVIGEASDTDTLKDQAKIDKISRHLDNQESYIKRNLANKDAETAQEISEFRNRIFGDKLGRGTEAIQNLSDEKLLSLMGYDKKKRNRAVTYLRSVAEHYDSTVSKIMNADKFLELSPDGMRRVTELTLRGYEINDNDYKDIEELSEYAYKAIIELAKLGVKIDSYKAIERYFEKNSNNSEKSKSLDTLLDFAGVRLKDGNRIANVLTTSEIVDNLDNDAVRGLRYNNENTSFQVGINKAQKEGTIPKDLKLTSSIDPNKTTRKKKSTDVEYDADKAVANTNLAASLEKTADLVNNTLDNVYKTSRTVLKTILQVSATAAEKAGRTFVPGVDTALDMYADYQERQYKDNRKQDEIYRDDEKRNKDRYKSDKRFINTNINRDYQDIEAGFDARRKGSKSNAVTEAREYQERQDKRNEERKEKEQEAKETTTTTVSNNASSGDSKVNTDTSNVDMNSLAQSIKNIFGIDVTVTENKDVGTHAGGLFAAFKDAAINGIAEKIMPGSTKKNTDNKAAEETVESTQQAQTEPVNKLEEYNDLREGNSITQTREAGLNLIDNPASGGSGGSSSVNTSSSGTVNIPTADGDPIQYTQDKNGTLVEKSNKNNIDIRQKQQYKLSLQERATMALEKLAKGGVSAGKSVGKTAKKAVGGFFDELKNLAMFPFELIGSMISMIPMMGPIMSLGASAVGFLAKFFGGKLLDKIAGMKVGQKIGGLIAKLRQTRIGNAIADRLGLDAFESRVEEANKNENNKNNSDGTDESGSDSGSSEKKDSKTSDTKTDSSDGKDNKINDITDGIKDATSELDQEEKKDNKNDNKNQNDNKNSGNKKRGFFGKIKDRLSNLKNKALNTKPGVVGKTVGGWLKRNKKTALIGAGLATIGGLELTNYGGFTGQGLLQNARYATGLDSHAFLADRYGIKGITADEQQTADALIKQGYTPEQVAEWLKRSPERGASDQDNLAEAAVNKTVDEAKSTGNFLLDTGKDIGNYLLENPIQNPITQIAGASLLSKLTGSTLKGAGGMALVNLASDWYNGDLKDQSLFDIATGVGGDVLLNSVGGGVGGSIIDAIKNRREQNRLDNEDTNARNNAPPVNNRANLLRDPYEQIKDQNLSAQELQQWAKEHKDEIEAYRQQQENLKNQEQNPPSPTQDNNRPQNNNQGNNKPGRLSRFRNSIKNATKSATKSVGNLASKVGKKLAKPNYSGAIKSILKSKKGKLGIAAAIATPFLLSEGNEAEASVLGKAHTFETKGSIKSNIDEKALTEDAEASPQEEVSTENQEQQEEGFLDFLRNNPIASTAIGFAGAIKGGEWGGKIGEKLLGSKGKTIGSLLGGTFGGNILDPSAITPEGILETYVTNKIWDKGTSLITDRFSKKDQTPSTDEIDEVNDELRNRNQSRIDEEINPRNEEKKSFSQRMKDSVSGIKDKVSNTLSESKGKITSAVSDTKTKVTSMANTATNTNMKTATTNAINAVKDGTNDGMLKVKALIGRLKEGIKSLTSNLGRWIHGKGPLNAIKNFTTKLLENISKPQNLKKAVAKLARSTLAAATGVGAVVVMGIGAISDFIHGYNSADELYKIKPGLATEGMKIVAGFVSALVGIIPFLNVLIPEDFVLELAIEYIGPAFGFGKRELEELRKSGDEEEKKQQNEVIQNSTQGDSFQSMVANASKGIISKVVSTADAAASSITDMGKTIANKVGESATVAKNWVADTAQTVGDWISDKASRGWEYLKDKANSAKETVSEIYNSASSTVKEKYESVKNTIKEHLPSFGSGKHSLYGMNKFYSQLDPKYAMKFNTMNDSITQSMSDSGCGPAALSNAMSSMGINVDPRLTARYALENGYKETDGGTRPEFFTDMMNKLGTGSSRLNTQNDIVSNLKQGNPVILMGKDGRGESKQNPYAENPHYVTATGIDRRGNIIVQDPESFTPNKVYKASNVLNKSTIAIGAGRGKPRLNRLYGRSRSIINHVAHKIKSSIPRMYGRSRYGRGGDMGAQIYEYLHKKIGLSSIVTAGIMGNMMAESGLMPDRVQGDGIITAPEITVDGETGYGLCQWTYITRQQGLKDFAAQQGKSSSDYQVQCDYLMYELENSYPGTIQAMDQTGDVRQAALKFHDMYEGSADTPEMKERRADYAEQILANEGKGIVEAGTYSGSSGSSGTTGAKKNTGFFGAISNIASILSSALNPFGSGADTSPTITTPTTDTKPQQTTTTDTPTTTEQTSTTPTTTETGKGKFSSRYGRFKHFVYGRGDEATTEGQTTTTTTEPSTNTPNMDAQEVQQAQDANANTQNQNKPTTTKQSSSSGGFMSGLESFAKSFAAPLGKAMSKFGSVLKSGVTSVFGSKLSFLFGDDNPFLSIFGGGESSSSGNKPGQTGPGQTMNVKVAGNPVDTLLGSMPGAVMTSDYGATEGRPTAGAHGGVDIGADEGTPIPSPISGTVVDLGSGYGGGYGNYIQVKDAKGNFHMFAHCASQSVSIGQQVQPGTVLGTVGDTGNSYGAHLHYEIDPPENEGAVKGGPTLNPNSYTGAGKHLTSLGMGKLVLPKYGMGGFDTSLVDKSADDSYEDITTLKPDTEIGEDIESANTIKEAPKTRNEVFTYDGFGVDKVPKYGTGWFSDFTKRSINTIKDAFSRWTKDWNEGEEAKPTETDSSTKSESANVVPSKQPSTTSKGQDIPVAPTTQETKTESKPQVSTSDQNTHTVTDTQKLDAILDAMNENNRLVKQQNQLLSSIINIASNYINSNVVRVDNKQQLTMNTNTRANNYDPTTLSVKAQLSQIGNGSQYGIGDRFGTRDADGFSEIIRTINEIATR